MSSVASKDSMWSRLYRGTTTFDFVGRRKIGFIISAVAIVISVVSLFTRELNLGLDFKGGVAWELPANGLSTDDVESILDEFGLRDGAKVQTLSGAGVDERIRAQVGPLEPAQQVEVRQRLADAAQVSPDEVNTSSVSSSWGDDITRKAVRALIFFFIALVIYISIRFEWRMAIAALVAVVHDVGISVGVYSVFGFEVTPATVIAFLTILGFSLYDTIVVFDKVHENTARLGRSGKATYDDVVNLSMNQVLMRSLNTSLAALLPVLSLLIVGALIMGAVALLEFSLALFVGLLTGSYSSIFVATPVLAILKRSDHSFVGAPAHPGRVTDFEGLRAAVETGVPVGSGNSITGSKARGPVTQAPVATTAPTHPPRPRKQKRR